MLAHEHVQKVSWGHIHLWILQSIEQWCVLAFTVWRVRSGARISLLAQRHFPMVRRASVSLTVQHHGPVWCHVEVKSSLWLTPALFQYDHSLLIKQRLLAAVFNARKEQIVLEVQVFSLLVSSCNENVCFVKRRRARWPNQIRTRLFLWAD